MSEKKKRDPRLPRPKPPTRDELVAKVASLETQVAQAEAARYQAREDAETRDASVREKLASALGEVEYRTRYGDHERVARQLSWIEIAFKVGELAARASRNKEDMEARAQAQVVVEQAVDNALRRRGEEDGPTRPCRC